MDRYNWKKSMEITKESERLKSLLGSTKINARRKAKALSREDMSCFFSQPVKDDNKKSCVNIRFFLEPYELN